MNWTTADIPDLTGRTAVVTGATSGLGLASTRALARSNAHVVLATRNPLRTTEVIDHLRTEVPGARLSHVLVDLADLDSVRDAVAQLRDRHVRLNLLINNAGVMNAPLRRTADGFELHFGVNHLGHFALTAGLVAAMDDALDPRIVTVSSQAARIGSIRWDDPNWESGRYSTWRAYAQSKLASQVFAVELNRRLRRARSPIASIVAHPGSTATDLSAKGHRLRGGLVGRVGSLASHVFDRLVAQDVDTGVLPQLFAATAPVAASGHYYGPADMLGMHGPPTEVNLVPAANDPDTGRRLWDLSRELTGVTWPFDHTDTNDDSDWSSVA